MAQVDSAVGCKTEDVGSSPIQGNSFFMEFHILQNTIDYVTKVGLWLRLTCVHIVYMCEHSVHVCTCVHIVYMRVHVCT